MKEKIKNNTAITMIALIISIIVLLILAGVSIAFLIGENGVISKADEAKIKTELTNYKEEVELYKTDKYLENSDFREDSLTARKYNIIL